MHSGGQDEFRKTCFRVPFIGSWIRRLGSPIRKASTNVQEPRQEGIYKCPGVPRLKQETSEMRSGVLLVILWPLPIFGSPCPQGRVFAFVGPTANSDPGFGWVISVGANGPKWGADSLPLFGCMLD
ncbi:hypothetical protein CRG98_008997 [Punica granatum]|uniref:Uncharacterized protein n=1 Tax=Punica granatum TaxID=22663 RepID=A0A2I0KQN0_PUNGR|nr:hypothetical protein CRG98_008997 [Punica granatum]